MAIAEVLAPGSTAADSADVVVTVDTLIVMKGSASGVGPGEYAQVIIKAKDEDGFYWPFAVLETTGSRSYVLRPGTYRLTRVTANTGDAVAPAAKFNCGVFTAA